MRLSAVGTIITAIAIGAFSAGTTSAEAQTRNIYNIGTGGIGGIFYPMGGYICNLMNNSRKAHNHNYRCTVESTAGTVGNLRGLQRNDLDMGLVQADMFYHAYHGIAPFEQPNKKLRFLMAFTTNSVTVVARADAKVQHVNDLKGKRVDTGAVGSGTEAISNVVMETFGFDPKKDFSLQSKLGNREVGPALCDNKIDAFIWAAGLGSSGIVETMTTCKANIVEVTGPQVDKLIKERPYYEKTVIPAGTYPEQQQDVTTFGYTTCLVTSEDLPDDYAYLIVKSVFENYDEFKKQHPGFEHMTRQVSAHGCKADVPVHVGAAKYFKEAGLN